MNKLIEDLEKNTRFLLQMPDASVTELRRLALEIEEAINSDEFQSQPVETRNRLLDQRKDLRSHLRQLEDVSEAQPADLVMDQAVSARSTELSEVRQKSDDTLAAQTPPAARPRVLAMGITLALIEAVILFSVVRLRIFETLRLGYRE